MKKITLSLFVSCLLFASSAIHAADTAAEEKQCAELGLKKGTPKFGECVMQMISRNDSSRKEEEAKQRDRDIVRQQQQRAEEARAEQERNLELRKQKIEEARQKWTDRCGFEKQKAYNQYIQEHNYDCEGMNGGMKSLCQIGALSNATKFSESAFSSCMSRFPF